VEMMTRELKSKQRDLEVSEGQSYLSFVLVLFYCHFY